MSFLNIHQEILINFEMVTKDLYIEVTKNQCKQLNDNKLRKKFKNGKNRD